VWGVTLSVLDRVPVGGGPTSQGSDLTVGGRPTLVRGLVVGFHTGVDIYIISQEPRCGVSPCTGQGTRCGGATSQGNDLGVGGRPVLVRDLVDTHRCVFFLFPTDVSGWTDSIGGVCFATNTLRLSSVFFVLVDGCFVENVSKGVPLRWNLGEAPQGGGVPRGV
jgi:hypothetical protein